MRFCANGRAEASPPRGPQLATIGRVFRCLVVGCLLLAGCTSDPASRATEPEIVVQSRVCERYIECAAGAAQGDAAAVRVAFGKASDCWTTPERAAACSQDCDSGLSALQADFGDVRACAECAEDIDCEADSTGPMCIEGRCRQCAIDSDCSGSGQAFCSDSNFCTNDLCDYTSECGPEEMCRYTDEGKRCRRCENDDECSLGVCIEAPSGNICRDCRTSADCFAHAPVCDMTTFDCGYCTTDAQCTRFPDRPHCDSGSFAGCVECVDDEDCKDPSRPKCSFFNSCVAS